MPKSADDELCVYQEGEKKATESYAGYRAKVGDSQRDTKGYICGIPKSANHKLGAHQEKSNKSYVERQTLRTTLLGPKSAS